MSAGKRDRQAIAKVHDDFQAASFAARVRLAMPIARALALSAVDLTTHNRTEEEPMLDDLVKALSGLEPPDFVTEDLDTDSSRLDAFMAYAGAAYALGVAVGMVTRPTIVADRESQWSLSDELVRR